MGIWTGFVTIIIPLLPIGRNYGTQNSPKSSKISLFCVTKSPNIQPHAPTFADIKAHAQFNCGKQDDSKLWHDMWTRNNDEILVLNWNGNFYCHVVAVMMILLLHGIEVMPFGGTATDEFLCARASQTALLHVNNIYTESSWPRPSVDSGHYHFSKKQGFRRYRCVNERCFWSRSGVWEVIQEIRSLGGGLAGLVWQRVL